MHQDEGHYAGKHPEDAKLNQAAAAAVKMRLADGRISCRAAHEAAAEAGVSPGVIGQTLDLLEVRINGCQLGLFGRGAKKGGSGEEKKNYPAELIQAVRDASSEGQISCYDLWQAADGAACLRASAAAVCEKEGIKIVSCQLGAF